MSADSADVSYVKPKRKQGKSHAKNRSQPKGNPSGSSAPVQQSHSNFHGKGKQKQCGNCGNTHQPGSCPAKGKQCSNCLKYNHFARVCRSTDESRKVSVNAHSVTSDAGCIKLGDSSSDSDFFVDAVDSVCTDTGQNQAFICAKLGPSKNEVKFKVDTESQVNILP